jgi:methyl-accepting chemotaxis protein
MKFRIQNSLKNQLIFIFSVILISVTTLVIIVATTMSSNYLQKDGQERIVQIANDVTNNLEVFVEERRLQLQSLAHNQLVVEYLKSGENAAFVKQELKSQFDSYQKFENIFMVSPEGFITLVATNEKAVGMDIKKFPFWSIASNGKDFHIDNAIHKSPVRKQLVMDTAVPVRENGKLLGLICASVSWETFASVSVDPIKIGKTGYVGVIDGNYNFAAHPNKDLLLKSSLSYDFTKKIKELGTGYQQYHFDGKWKMMSFQTSPSTDYKILCVIDESDFLGRVTTIRLVVIGIGILGLIGGIIAVFIFARSITRPIALITQGAEQISVGDINLAGMDASQIRKITEREDELGSIGKAFDKLIDYLQDKVKLTQEIADGDLTVNVTVTSEQDQLGHALSQMVNKLAALVSDITSSSSNVASGADQLSSTAQAMSQGATEQAASVEEITSSMNEISNQIKQNADNGEQANNLAENARSEAEEGSGKMGSMITAISNISESSQNVSKIIKVIDEIAFQINLLSLNAAVEAARAGVHGKGFAVVADEVRNLAARSATAAKEITEMIETSVKQVESGTEIADQTSEALKGIVDSVTKITDIVGEIAQASKEQAESITQITEGLDQIDQVTQQSSAHSEESAASAEELSSQAAVLQDLIKTFEVSDSTYGRSPAPHFSEETEAVPQLTIPANRRKKVVGTNGSKGVSIVLEENWNSGFSSANSGSGKSHLSASEFGKY